ncbi:MAG: alpha/beta hydrolase [Spirosomaceae bacterium]|jgi:pimeloyl-ACP methyl ester carboxylesterase|nr:alpha/beta hydrolase [Spirosomataceae bacterium]
MKKLFKIIKLSAIFIGVLLLVGMTIFWQNDIPINKLKAKYTNNESKFIEIDGMNVHYRDEGNSRDSLPIVLIHGTGASLHTWEGWVSELKITRRVITMDLPAYGLTGPNPAKDYSMPFYIQFIDKFLSKLAIKKMVIGGNSLGGSIAWNYTLAYPAKVEKLILVDAGGYPTKPKSVPIIFRLARMPIVNNIFKVILPRSAVESSVKNVYVDDSKVTDELVDRYFELSLREGNRQAFLDRMMVFTPKPDEKSISKFAQIKNIQIPTLILWGAEDGLIPTDVAQKFHEDLPKDTLVIFPNLGHTPMEEDPTTTVNEVKKFLNRNP